MSHRKKNGGDGLELSPEQAAAAAMVAEAKARGLELTGTGRARWTMRWKPVLNAFAITFGDRWPAAETY